MAKLLYLNDGLADKIIECYQRLRERGSVRFSRWNGLAQSWLAEKAEEALKGA